jgi:hypothetical protein
MSSKPEAGAVVEAALSHFDRAVAATPGSGFDFLTPEEMNEPQGEPDWVVRGLGICPGRPAAVIGPGSAGKTTLAALLGLCVQTGARFLGEFHCPPANVVWLDFEMGRRASLRKLRRLCKGHGLDWAAVVAGFRLAVYPRTFLNSPEAEAELTKAVQGARLCVVDSLRRSLPGVDENDSRIADHLQMLARVSDATGCAFLVVHHASAKAEQNTKGKPDRRNAGRGSTAIYDGSGSYIVLDGPEGEPPRVTHVREPQEGRLFEPFHIRVEDFADGADEKAGLRVAYLTKEQINAPTSPAARFSACMAEVLDVIRANPGARGTAHVAVLMGAAEKTIREPIKQLIEDGLVRDLGAKGSKGRAVRYHAVDVAHA